ncbi:MAG: DUF4386 domain-containing protein [Candidatus Thorarchaeota archaeon]
MSQGFLSPRECARNSGTFLLVRLLLGALIYLSLNATFPIPRDSMLAVLGSIKANVFLLIGILAVLFFFALFSLIVAFPINNVLTSIHKDLSKAAQYLRILEWLIFLAGMVLMFLENPLFIQVLLFGLLFYTGYLMIIGYLIFTSGYLNRVLGISLIAAPVGYVLVSLTGCIAFTSILILLAIVAEYSFAIYFIVKSLQIEVTDPKETITMILEELGEATTTEIIDESSKVSAECKDRIPEALRVLESENRISKKLSKEKKGYVWSLVK